MRVLLVEDDIGLRQLTARGLRQAGMAARRAVNLFIDFVDERQFFFRILAATRSIFELLTNKQALADQVNGRSQDIREHLRIERRRLAGIAREDGDQ